jgi:hypothetical protein
MADAQTPSVNPLSKSRIAIEARRRKVLRGMINGKNLSQATLDAGYSESMAAVACREIMPHIRGAFQEAMLNKIPLGKLSDTVAAGLDAKETKVFSTEAGLVYSKPLIAWGERRRYAALAANLMGVEPEKAAEAQPGRGLLVEVVSESSMARVSIVSAAGPGGVVDVTPEPALPDGEETPEK